MGKLEFKSGIIYNTETLEFSDRERVILRLQNNSHGIMFNLIVNSHLKRVVSKKEIADILWGGGNFDYTRALNQKLFFLRQRLKEINLGGLVITVRGKGYKINQDLIITPPWHSA